MITLYNRKDTNESLGENEEKHSTGKTHQRQICAATENITGGPQGLGVLSVDFQLKRLEIIFQPSLEGGVKGKNSLLDQSMK